MHKNLFILFVLIYPISLLGNHPYNLNLNKKDDNLRGKVSVVIEQIRDFGKSYIIVKSYSQSGMLVRANYYEPRDTSSALNLDTTNLSLERLEEHEYRPDNKLIKTKITGFKNEKLEYTKQNYYNKNDSIIAIVTTRKTKNSIIKDSTNIYYLNYKDSILEFTLNNLNDTITKKVIFRNTNGSLSKILTKELDNSCINIQEYYFDNKGNLITLKETELSEDETDKCEYSFIRTCIYDENNRIIYMDYLKQTNSTERRVQVCEYNINGMISSNSNYYFSDNIIKGYEKSTLDENNNYITTFNDYLYSDNKLVKIFSQEIINKYKYDINWNWTECKELSEGKQRNYKRRIVKYYE